MANTMNTKSKTLRTYLFSTFGLVAMAAIIVAVNLILGNVNLRVDCTEENLHTLADGTRQILEQLKTDEQNVAIRFYFSRDVTELPMSMKNYARRIENLLKEYRRHGHGCLTVDVLNPEPDSEAEDSARMDGVRPMQLGFDSVYFGMAIACLDEVETLSELPQQRENALEYEITRAIHRVVNPDKPRIGVISSLPIMGSNNQNPMMAMRGMGRTPPWAFVEKLRRDYELEEIPKDSDAIAGEFKALLIVHPKDLSDKMLYAIDQYLLQGGRILAFVDPLSILGQQRPNPMMGMQRPPPDQPSSLGPLLETWGVELDGKDDEPGVLADTRFMFRVTSPIPGQPDAIFPTVLDLTDEDAINQDELAVGDLAYIRLVSGGAFRFVGDTGLTRSNLLLSSEKAGFVEPYQAKALDPQSGSRIRDGLEIDNVSHVLAVRLQGTFQTAFPDGKPTDADGDKDEDKDEEKTETGLKESAEEGHVVLVADSDMLGNEFAFNRPRRNAQGGVEYTPANHNVDLLLNLLDWLSGGKSLISLRSRDIKPRPLQRFRDMLSETQEEYQAEQERLEKERAAAAEKLQKLLEKNPPVRGRRYHLSPEMAEEIKDLEKKRDETEKRKKELRKEYRAGVESLKKRLMFLNIGLTPLLVAIVGIVLALIKRRRTVRK